MKEYDKKSEELLLELAKQDELKNRKLMTSMWTILITSAIFYIGILLLAVNTLEEGILLGTIICVSTMVFVIAGFIALKFEVDAGYYECKKCHHKFIPTYKEAVFAMHMSTTRYLKCQTATKRVGQKKLCLNNKLQLISDGIIYVKNIHTLILKTLCKYVTIY